MGWVIADTVTAAAAEEKSETPLYPIGQWLAGCTKETQLTPATETAMRSEHEHEHEQHA